jgi:hypothetical protein
MIENQTVKASLTVYKSTGFQKFCHLKNQSSGFRLLRRYWNFQRQAEPPLQPELSAALSEKLSARAAVSF